MYRQQSAEAVQQVPQQAPGQRKGRGGFISKARQATAAADAQRALAEGHTIFVIVTSNGIQWLSGTSLSSVAEQIEAVEAAGWRLDHSSYVFDTTGMGNTLRGVHTFRREALP